MDEDYEGQVGVQEQVDKVPSCRFFYMKGIAHSWPSYGEVRSPEFLLPKTD